MVTSPGKRLELCLGCDRVFPVAARFTDSFSSRYISSRKSREFHAELWLLKTGRESQVGLYGGFMCTGHLQLPYAASMPRRSLDVLNAINNDSVSNR